jgi:hypothetical protein
MKAKYKVVEYRIEPNRKPVIATVRKDLSKAKAQVLADDFNERMIDRVDTVMFSYVVVPT